MLASSSFSFLPHLHRTELWRPCLTRAQQQQQHGQGPSRDEPSKVRPDINPSVLRALHGEQPAVSLIEKNLRKRARSRQESDGHASSVADDVEDFAARQAIRSVIWEEAPQDLALPNFMFLDIHARLFRAHVLFQLLKETSISPAAVLWFILPADALSLEPASLPPSLLLKWAKWRLSVAADLSRVAGDSRIYVEAGLRYWELWNDEKISDEKKICLTTAMALILDVEMLEAVRSAGGGGEGVEKRLAESSAALGGAMRELQKEAADPQAVWDMALKGTGMASDGRVYVLEEALIFPVIRDSSGDGGKKEAGELARALSQVEQSLKESYPSRAVLFLPSKTHRELFYAVIAPWYWFLRTSTNTPLNWLLFAASFLATSQFAPADPGLNPSWIASESGVVSLGWSAILASGVMAMRFVVAKHNASSSLRNPAVFAFPLLGAVGRCGSFAAILPSRGVVLDALLSGSCASLLVSCLLFAIGFVFWGPSHFNSVSTADFRGYLLVPSDLFSHSQVFTKLLDSASVALLKVEEDGDLALATSPFAFAGLLGLNFVAFCLLPTAPKTDGFHLLRALLGDTELVGTVSVALTVAVSISLLSKSPTLGVCWLAYSFFFSSEISYIADEVSEPSFLKRMAGFVLVAAALICFVPVFQ